MKQKLNPLTLIQSTPELDDDIKKKILSKLKVVEEAVSEIEEMSGISYPEFYVEPVLTISVSSDSYGGIGILYARTIPVESKGTIEIVVQLSAALLLCGTKPTLRLIIAHEFLHYVELVKQFSSGRVLSQITSSSLFEEGYEDSGRAVDPIKIFRRKRKLAKELEAAFHGGFSDEKLNEKCRKSWIEKGLPTVRMAMGANQVKISMRAVASSAFDPKVVELVSKLDSLQ